MKNSRNTHKVLIALAIGLFTLSLSSCALFKKDCDCPTWSQVDTNEQKEQKA